MKIDTVIRPLNDLQITWDKRFFLPGSLEAKGSFKVVWDSGSAQEPQSVTTSDAKKLTAAFDGMQASVVYKLGTGNRFVDEAVNLDFHGVPVILNDISIGLSFDLSRLKGFTLTPIPFRIGMKGESQVIDLNNPTNGLYRAEGWVLSDGEDSLLVMRVPSGSEYTSFITVEVKDSELLICGIGIDKDHHRERNPFLDKEWTGGNVEFPITRYVSYKGDWKTGFEIFRQMVADSLPRLKETRRRPSPLSYNTYHDFGPEYDRARLAELMPVLSDMGIGLLHLDPGWETGWGSNAWNDSVMGDLDGFVADAARHGLKVGCWTSVHTKSAELFDENAYTLNADGQKYYAEDFGEDRLWGVCPASPSWREAALRNLSRLGKAGFVFLNSDFHDWPWDGSACWSDKHNHETPITRVQWSEALNSFYEELHRRCPNMVIEMHDHVGSGNYHTPVWYLFDRADSYDEKWAYEFMWSTYQDLMDRKLFSLYHIRLAEPIPLFLHMNASSDNENAIAFWYVASCVSHMGVGAIKKSSDAQRQAYKKAFAEYNARFDAFTLGAFYGIDELTHVHVYPDSRRAVILAFNLDDKPVEREFEIDLEAWDMKTGEVKVEGADLTASSARVAIPPKGVTIVDLSVV